MKGADPPKLTTEDFDTKVVEKIDKKFKVRTEKPWLILFYHSFHQYSQDIIPDWKDLYHLRGEFVNIGMIDCSSKFDGSATLCMRFLKIHDYPSIYYFEKNMMYEYHREHSLDEMTRYLDRGMHQKAKNKKEIPERLEGLEYAKYVGQKIEDLIFDNFAKPKGLKDSPKAREALRIFGIVLSVIWLSICYGCCKCCCKCCCGKKKVD